MKLRELYYGFVIDWSFYPQTVVGEPEPVDGKTTWRVRVHNRVLGTGWYSGSPDENCSLSSTEPCFGVHPPVEQFYAAKAEEAERARQLRQREHEAYMARLDAEITAREALLVGFLKRA